MKKTLLLSCLLCVCTYLCCISSAYGQTVAHTFAKGSSLIYNQNFDGMGATGTNYPAGWQAVNLVNGDPLPLINSNGSAGTYGMHNVGTSGDNDRALGSIANHGTHVPRFGAVFKNSTGNVISEVVFEGVCEQWRASGRTPFTVNNERHGFEISFNANSLNDPDADWTAVSSFDLYEIRTELTASEPLDGNANENRQAISATVGSLNWQNNTNMWIRWTDDVVAEYNALLAIDELKVAVAPLVVTSPVLEVQWEQGTSHDITWYYANITGNVTIKATEFVNASNPPWEIDIASDVPVANGYYTWDIPDNFKLGGYKIKLISGTNEAISDEFYIVKKRIKITSPTAGAKWVKGSSYVIRWVLDVSSPGNVKIELTRNASAVTPVWDELAASVNKQDRRWTWNITQNASNDCKIRITDLADGYTSLSKTFSIIDPADVPKVFISEYIAGSDNNRAIEIYNGTGATIDLAKLRVYIYDDGDQLPTTIIGNNFTGTLDAGKVFVLCHENAVAGIKDYENWAYPALNYTGDAAIEIVYDGIRSDVFGVIGEQPAGGGWTVGGVANATKDHTLLRKLNVIKGDYAGGVSFTNNEWVVKELNYFDNIGAFGTAIAQGASTGLAASYDVPISGVSSFNLILNHSNSNIVVNSNLNNVNNLVLKKGGTTTFTIKPNFNLGIAGGVVNKSPTATAGTAKFNIESTAEGTGTLLHNFSTTGNIKRYISGNAVLTANCYHGVSVPLKQGTNLVSNLFNGSYLYKFSETLNQWEGMGSATNTQLYADRGYLIYYPGANITYNFNGTFNYGFFPIPYTSAAADKGFNFVPNPYPSHIDFSEIENFPASLSQGFWIWNAQNGNYVAYNVPAGTGTTTTSDTISIGQAFFVKATAAGTFALNNKCRVGNRADKVTPFYSTGSQRNTLRIAANGNQLQDEILFVVDNKWNLGTDEGDMVKMIGSEEAPQLGSINADNENLTINTLPLNRYETVIPLSFTLNASTQVQFVADNRSLQSNITPYLIDKKENRSVNLRQNPVYTFNHANTDTDNRFELKLVNAVYSTPYDLADENMIYVNSNNQIIVSVPSMQNTKTMVNIYDMQGKLVSSNSVYLTDTFVTQAPVVSGVYVVSVVNSTQTVNKKVVVTR